MFKRLKTSEKISLQFSFVNLFSLLLLLLAINIIYFAIWYNDQKTESLADINSSYELYSREMTQQNMDLFREYILQQDSIIVEIDGEITCSE